MTVKVRVVRVRAKLVRVSVRVVRVSAKFVMVRIRVVTINSASLMYYGSFSNDSCNRTV